MYKPLHFFGGCVHAGDPKILLTSHAFDFCTQLLRNVLRKFLSVKDMSAALLVRHVSQHLFRYAFR